MSSRRVIIGILLLVVVFGSAFFFCPKYNGWMSKGDRRITSHATDGHIAKSENKTSSLQTGSMPSISSDYSNGSYSAKDFKKLEVIPLEELKQRNYHAYVYRRHLENGDAKTQKISSKLESQRWVKEELGPRILAELEKSS